MMTDSDIGMTHLGSWIQSNCTAMDAGILVLILINYIVITKRATRIAEVTARSTLDAMPGKQMAIDADLNAGLLSDEEARNRRKEIAAE